MNNSRLLVPFVAVALVAPAFAAKPAAKGAAVTTIEDALKQAKEGKKFLFIQYGREACGNCRHLRDLIGAGKVVLSKNKYVYADVNCDDRATSAAFREKFKVDGATLPFVVVTDSEGRQLASRSGFGDAKVYAALLAEAARKARTLPAVPATPAKA